jgi:hypothetical protein
MKKQKNADLKLVKSYQHKQNIFCEISGSCGGDYEDCCLLGCCALQSGRSLPTFEGCLLPPFLFEFYQHFCFMGLIILVFT